MKIFTLFLLLLTSPFTLAQRELKIPNVASVNEGKKDFIDTVSAISRNLFANNPRTAIAPFGGVKLTPFLELDLRTLIIITNSYPGTPEEIEEQFTRGYKELKQILTQSLERGSMSTTDVLSVSSGAQIISRLNLEMGVNKVTMSYWVNEDSTINKVSDFSGLKPRTNLAPAATIFEFNYQGEKAKLIFLTAEINQTGFPQLLWSFIPDSGIQWAYLSADGLGHFSANRNNGLSIANNELLNTLQSDGAILLDYPTSPSYFAGEEFNGVFFMQGRLDLEEIKLKRLLTIPIDVPRIFGYCLRPGDEVRIYKKIEPVKIKARLRLKQIGKNYTWPLK